MKKMVLVALGLLVIVGVVLFLNLGSVVKTAIETAGTQAAGTAVRVSGLNLSLADKKATLRGLTVANPQGFKTDDLLKASAISVTVGDITDKVVTIKEIVVDGMTVAYELGPQGTNFDAIQKNLKSSAPKTPAAGGSNAPGVIIERLRIIHAQVIPTIGGAQAPVSLPDIVLNNIGSKSNPATPTQVAAKVMNQVMSASSAAAMKSGLAAPLDEAVGKVKEGLKGIFSK
ncbi:MAG: hypothetical protein K8R48_08365 [Alphaproteobacteria bacterium]|nr:hypothetical protein [Alphaproteobacteria bacterium]